MQQQPISIAELFLQSAIKRFNEYKTLGDKTIERLSIEQLQQQPNAQSNSIALIVQHMHGNMKSRWTNFLTEDGEKSWRNRDAEFEVQPHSKEGIIQRWNAGWDTVFNALHLLKEDDLLKPITIRQQPLTVIDAINRQLAHYSYHVGQIVYLGKWLLAENWESLSIAKGKSEAYNEALKKDK